MNYPELDIPDYVAQDFLTERAYRMACESLEYAATAPATIPPVTIQHLEAAVQLLCRHEPYASAELKAAVFVTPQEHINRLFDRTQDMIESALRGDDLQGDEAGDPYEDSYYKGPCDEADEDDSSPYGNLFSNFYNELAGVYDDQDPDNGTDRDLDDRLRDITLYLGADVAALIQTVQQGRHNAAAIRDFSPDAQKLLLCGIAARALQYCNADTYHPSYIGYIRFMRTDYRDCMHALRAQQPEFHAAVSAVLDNAAHHLVVLERMRPNAGQEALRPPTLGLQ